MYRHLHPAGGRAEVLPEVLQVSGRSRSGDHEQRRSAAKRRAGGGPRSECHSKSSLRGHGTAPGIVFSSMPSVDLAGEIRSKRERDVVHDRCVLHTCKGAAGALRRVHCNKSQPLERRSAAECLWVRLTHFLLRCGVSSYLLCFRLLSSAGHKLSGRSST